MSCKVCGVQGGEPHFGAVTCGACAAFFRRYFHSKKAIISCSCHQRLRNSHPCRECRMKKCLAVGMVESKVQKQREKHRSSSKRSSLFEKSTPSPVDLIIIPRCTTKITATTSNWVEIQEERNHLFRKTLDETDYYELTSNKRTDSLMMWKIAEGLFPEVGELMRLDRDSLLRNFLPKWSVLAAVIDFEVNTQKYSPKLKTMTDYKKMIADFYQSSFPCQLSEQEILTVFEPIVTFYGVNVIIPMRELGFDKTEYMALTLLILFDAAYTNISVECSELCFNIRKLIMKELKGYQADKNCDEMRFVETIDALNIIERGERKFYEELILCDMHGVELHEDFQLMLKEHNT